jgi:hypothetical protein
MVVVSSTLAVGPIEEDNIERLEDRPPVMPPPDRRFGLDLRPGISHVEANRPCPQAAPT